jgi:Flp pilus assembly protein TadB
MSPLLAGFAGLLLFASAWELAGFGAPPALRRARRRARALAAGMSVGERSARSRAAERLERAGLGGRVSIRAFLVAKGCGGALGALAFALVAPIAPGRLVQALAVGLVAAGFLAPDAAAVRAARKRRERIASALPDALDCSPWEQRRGAVR